MTTARLTRDITASDLAIDSPDPDEGYRPEHVIGPVGSTVTVLDAGEGEWVEVTDFDNDRWVQGFVHASDVRL